MTDPKPLRIVHVFRAMLGGLFRHVVDLATEQARAGHEVGIVCDSTTGGDAEAQALERLQPHLPLGATRLPMRRAVGPADLITVARMHQPLLALRPDIIHGHGAKGGVYARLVGTWLGRDHPVARIYTPHGGSLHYDPRSPQGMIYFGAERLLLRLTDAIVHISEYEAAIYRAKVTTPHCAVAVIPNGLRPDEFVPVAPIAAAHDLLFLGELRELKGIDVLLDAIALLHHDGAAPSLLVVGPGNPEPYIKRARDHGISEHVTFRGPMPARDAFALARAIVVPSRAESMPYVVLEAIAAGLPIIATDVGGIPEIFGGSEALVAPGDAAALASAIKQLTGSPQQAAAQAATRRDTLRLRFTVAAMQRDIAAVYVAALSRRADTVAAALS